MGRIKNFLILVGSLGLLLAYTNCSAPDSSSVSPLQSPPANSLQGNGGGHPGKLRYNHFSTFPSCSNSNGAEQSIEIDFGTQEASFTDSVCAGSGTNQVDLSEVFFNDYNPFVSYFNSKVFVTDDLHEGIDNARFFYDYYCYNQTARLDFIVQRIRPRVLNPVVTSYGILIDGNTGSSTFSKTEVFIPDGVSSITALDGSYSMTLSLPGRIESPGSATITWQNGDALEMHCLTNEVISDN